MKTKKRIFSREDFLALDDEGNYFVSQIGLNADGDDVWQWRACDKPNCNCTGGWEAGMTGKSVVVIDRPSEGEQVVLSLNKWGHIEGAETVKI